MPFRWATIDIHYYLWMKRREGGLLFLLFLVGIGAGLTWAGYGALVIFGWLLPARIAIGCIACSFSYFPHAPHEATSREDRYRASNILLFPGLTPTLLYQNFHLIHHLYPGVPFYRYARIFRWKRAELEAKGAPIYGVSKRP